MSNGYEDFRAALIGLESSGNYGAVNGAGYLGAYQFGEAALIDIGLVLADDDAYDNDLSGGWTGLYGVDSTAEFLATPEAQDAAADDWFEILWGYAEYFGLDDYLGTFVNGIYVTASGIIGGAHLVGIGGVMTWLDSGGETEVYDGNGTPVSYYVDTLSGYQMAFDTGESLDDLIPGRLIDGTEDGEFLLASDAADLVAGNGGADIILGKDGDDSLSGGEGRDKLLAGDGDDALAGDAGGDLLIGGAGGDTMFGGAGDDIMTGGAGRDLMYGGAGDDLLLGSDGTDLFIFEDGFGTDRIIGFDASSTGDVIVLTDVSAIVDYNDLVANHMAQVGGNVVISDGQGNSVTLVGFDLDELEAGDFVFYDVA